MTSPSPQTGAHDDGPGGLGSVQAQPGSGAVQALQPPDVDVEPVSQLSTPAWTRPSPHDAFLQLDKQPALLPLAAPLSHCSPPTGELAALFLYPSPQLAALQAT